MSDYTDTVDRYLDGLDFISTGLLDTCPDCLRDYSIDPDDAEAVESFRVHAEEVGDEGGFRWSPCEVCGSPDTATGRTLGGNRYTWHAVNIMTDSIVHGECCTDCLMYLANGEEPDLP